MAQPSTRFGLKIIRCPDAMRWYSSHIGETFPLLADFGDEFKSREPEGYVNFIQKGDCEVVELTQPAS
ncbi:hypothetical protein [Marinobacter salsuginis]|jgi:hypothetical protein|uniref:Uncharacterized protein n=1 Tax=Marinobacter salsuginis TaxID=418719 RepID=A0A5M3Q260_9GAMM|nr:hypothetical protein [Marinobacter salsuginis]GBO89216.1 hypothetical protein MSSD14B_28840 [Marinobacter salsuginis]